MGCGKKIFKNEAELIKKSSTIKEKLIKQNASANNKEYIWSKARINRELGINEKNVGDWKKNKPEYYAYINELYTLLEEKLIQRGIHFNHSPFIQFYLKSAYQDKYQEKVFNFNENKDIEIKIPD